MKKILAAVAVTLIATSSVHALQGTNEWKYKANTNVSDVMERAMTNGYVYTAHTNYVSMRNKWEKYFGIVITNEIQRIYSDQRTRDANEAAKTYWTNLVNGIQQPATGD